MVAPADVLSTLWIVWILSWLIATRWTAANVAKESAGERLRYGVFLWAGGFLLFFRPTARGPLLRPLFPMPLWLAWASVLVAGLGFGITWWARIHLGRLWSSAVTLKEGHTIVRTGPYALTRHPIYTGLLLALTATAFLRDIAASFGGLALVATGIVLKLRQEESLLASHFGSAYRDYQAQVPALIPRIW